VVSSGESWRSQVASESTRERRERLDTITARIRLGQHTVADVSWLREIAEEYISNWEWSIARLRRKTQNARSVAWPTTDPDAVQASRNRRRAGGT